MGVSLEGESGGGVPGKGLEVTDGLTALGEQGEAAMPEVELSLVWASIVFRTVGHSGADEDLALIPQLLFADAVSIE